MNTSPPIDVDLSWGAEQQPEPVEVDQRALIDKILARYSTKFPVLRELLQNADDARAKHAFIRFETKSFIDRIHVGGGQGPNLESNVYRWTIHNDGEPFSLLDWDRLKTIADGNPDEQKIGAFGVGFYSVFSVTDEPSVKSGGKRMRFHWKDNRQLFVSRSSQMLNSSDDSIKWTSFELPAHTPSPLSGTPTDIGRFLAASLPFMVNLQLVTVAFDSYTLLRLYKSSERPTCMPLLRNLSTTRDAGLMKVVEVNKRDVRIDAEKWVYQVGSSDMPSFGSTVPQCSSLIVHSENKMLMWSAEVKVTLDPSSELALGLEKAMKKSVPKQCRYQLIYTENDEAAREEDKNRDSLFERLKPNLQGVEAYVHIGHATTQTTGIAGHIAARFIPTVERELIDFENKNVKTWNEALLHVGGYLARTIYEHEMDLAKSSPVLHWKGLHALQFFTFHESTPHASVSAVTKKAFFRCSSSVLPIVSSAGVLPACDVRDYDATCASFVKKVPMLPLFISTGAREMVDDLKKTGIIKPIDFSDIMRELTPERIFSEQEIVACLKWVVDTDSIMGLTKEEVWSFVNNTRVLCDGSSHNISLSTIRTILDSGDASFIPSQSPLPDHTLPFAISRLLPVERLVELFGWKQLSTIDWLENLISLLTTTNLITGEDFADQVSGVLASAWKSILDEEKERIRKMLAGFACIPTQQGMRQPKEAYLRDSAASTFLDLPMVSIGQEEHIPEPLRSILVFLGVRERIDLVSLLKVAEMCRQDALQYFLDNYQHYRIAFEEDHKEVVSNMTFIPAVDKTGRIRMVRPSEAFMDKRCLAMGFWIIQDRFRADATKLDVSSHPPISKLITTLRNQPPTDRATAKLFFEYLSSRSACHEFTDQDLYELSSMPFVPVSNIETNMQMVTPGKCYVGEASSQLYSELFTFVYFGNHANSFLSACGAKKEPTLDDIATVLAQNPDKFLRLAGGLSQYMRELRNIAENRSEISDETMKKLRDAPVLLGSPYKSYGLRHKSWDSDEHLGFAAELLLPSQVVIVDDARNYTLFRDVENLFHAPKHLEKFYKELGCRRLSELIDEQYDPDGGEVQGHRRSTEIRELVLQRLLLFVTALENSDVDERYNWMGKEGNFRVRVFRKIRVTKVLNFGGKKESRSCDITAGYWGDDESFELLLTTEALDYFDVACCISKLFFETPTSHVYVLLMTLLSTSLPVLRQRGYNVDPIYNPKPVDNASYILNSPAQTFGANQEHEEFNDQASSVSSLPAKNTSWLESAFKYPSQYLRNKSNNVKWKDIDKDLDLMIKSGPGTSTRHELPTAISLRKEKANQYCGGSKYNGKIRWVTTVGPCGVYVGKDVTNKDLFQKQASIECFISTIINPLQGVFGYVEGNVRVLCDPECRHLTAFNRNGEIYLNLGYFEREHYKKENVTIPEKLLSWYFTLAHEFTHNIVPTHNANFELIFSRMCQRYALSLFKLPPLQQAVNDDSWVH